MSAFCVNFLCLDLLAQIIIIQHLDNRGPDSSADCRPPVLRKIGSVKPSGDLTHPAE